MVKACGLEGPYLLSIALDPGPVCRVCALCPGWVCSFISSPSLPPSLLVVKCSLTDLLRHHSSTVDPHTHSFIPLLDAWVPAGRKGCTDGTGMRHLERHRCLDLASSLFIHPALLCLHPEASRLGGCVLWIKQQEHLLPALQEPAAPPGPRL